MKKKRIALLVAPVAVLAFGLTYAGIQTAHAASGVSSAQTSESADTETNDDGATQDGENPNQ